jgi:hypothetical protein
MYVDGRSHRGDVFWDSGCLVGNVITLSYVPDDIPVQPSAVSHLAVADRRALPVVGEIKVPARLFCVWSRLPAWFVKYLPPVLTFLVVDIDLISPIIVGTRVCSCINLCVSTTVAGVSAVMGGAVPVSPSPIVPVPAPKHSDQSTECGEFMECHE